MRIESGQESSGSDGSLGWMHKVEEGADIEIQPLPKQERARLTPEQVTALAKKAFNHPRAPEVREKLADDLGVSVDSLEALRVGFGCDWNGKVWSSWPSRDGRGAIIGISRRYENGEKKTIAGCRNGLYFPASSRGLRGPVLIVEGGSDVAAAYTSGLLSIGRPSNTGGAGMIRTKLRGAKCVVIGENDESADRRGDPQYPSCPRECAGCGRCWPGLFGAKSVARQLACEFVMPPEGMKDFRDIVRRGSIEAFMRDVVRR